MALFGFNVFDKHYHVAPVAQPLDAIMGINNPNLGVPARYGVLASVKALEVANGR